MVWNTTQSALYKAIDAFNNGEITGTEQDRLRNSFEKAEMPPKTPQKDPENNGDNMECPRLNCRHCPARQISSPAPLSKLFSDNDMLLIAGLILILSRQNADRKLILALAFVLLT